MEEARLEQCRYFLKDSARLTIDFSKTDQSQGVSPPPVEKPFETESTIIELLKKEEWKGVPGVDLLTAIEHRESRRKYRHEALSLEELSYLLWVTQGIKREIRPGVAFRTVPSAGCRHALETYLCVLNVEGLERGMYRYLPVEHQLLFEFYEDQLEQKIVDATLGQVFTGNAAVTFIWTAIPYRMEWRYGLVAHKVIAVDAGHVCQNLYLACEAIGSGTCAIAAYHQELADKLIRVDGKDEFVIYMAPVGKV